MANKVPEISFVIPAKDEEKSVDILYTELTSELKKLKKTYEIIFIDDGSKDSTYINLVNLRKKDNNVKIIKHRGNWGKAVALQNGFDLSKGKIIFTLDADLQDNPNEISKFLDKLSEGYDLVSGWKKIRHDPTSKLISTKLFNKSVQILSGLNINDVNCGFKAYKREVVENIDFYGDLFRLIPVIAHKQNFRVGEVVVEHRARKYGSTKYGLKRSYKGILDLVTVLFLTGYLKRPAHFFGGLGLISFGMGFSIGLYITYLRLTTGSIQFRQPLLFLGVLTMVIGVQLISTGLIAELIVNFNHRDKHPQSIENLLS